MTSLADIQYRFIRMIPRPLRRGHFEKTIIQHKFRQRFGYELDLANPVTFNEKINWLKLYDRNPLMTICSDKYAVRQYVIDKVPNGEKILNQLYGVYNTVEEIDFDTFPNQYVLKAAHGSSWNIIVKNHADLNIKKTKQELRKWLKRNLYDFGIEWGYKDVSPRIICEKYMENTDGSLTDYKIHCFNGNPKLIQVVIDRHTSQDSAEMCYDTQWRSLNTVQVHPPPQQEINRPTSLPEMLNIANFLSSDFRYARVDLYEVYEKPVFGEITFYPTSGIYQFSPSCWNKKIGDFIKLPDSFENEDVADRKP